MNITLQGMPRRKTTARATQRVAEIDATGAVHEYVRARFCGQDSKIKRIAARYGWSTDKAKQIHAGAYSKISANDVFKIIAIDGAGARDALFAPLLVPPPHGEAAVRARLAAATALLEAVLCELEPA